METVLLLIAVLACPLGMLAMGGIAWVSGKAFGRSKRVAPGHDHRSAYRADEPAR